MFFKKWDRKLLEIDNIYIASNIDVLPLPFLPYIKLIPGSYEVVVSKSGLSKFTSKDRDLSYFIALEPDVKYEEWNSQILNSIK